MINAIEIPTGKDVEYTVWKWKRCMDLTSGQQIIIRLLFAGFCFLFLVGCSSDPSAWQIALREADTALLTVSHKTNAVVNENTKALEEIKESIESLEASLVVSDPNGKEVIESEDTSPDKIATDSQPSIDLVAESGDVPLVVTNAPFPCPPCERLKRDIADGKFAGFTVRFDDTWTPRSYPAIRYQSATSSTGWAAEYGYDSGTIGRLKAATGTNEFVSQLKNTNPVVSHSDLVSIHNDLHGGGNWTWPGDLSEHLRNDHGVMMEGAPVGAIFPRGSNNQVTSQRGPVRSLFSWFR